MIRIQSIILKEIRLPLKEPFVISSGKVENRRILLLKLQDVDGYEAWSECVAGEFPNYSPETIDTAWLAISQWIAPRVLGRVFKGPEEIFLQLQKDFRGHLMAKAAVEMGVWGLAAHKQGVSLAKLLGGNRKKIPVGISIGLQKSPEILLEKVKMALAQGYRKIKVKIKPGADLKYIKFVRESLGSDAPLMVDANNAYTMEDVQVLKALDEFNLMMIEQPLAWDDLVRHAELQRQIKTPICLDESITSVERAQDMFKLGSGKIINIKPGRVGGFSASIAIHNFCAAHKIPVWCGGMLESGIGRAYNVALASLPNFVYPGDISPSNRYWEKDIVSPEWQMDKAGYIAVPVNKPGIGVGVDEDLVENLTVRQRVLS